MAFGVLIHRTDSVYEDIPSERYQFPKKYLSRMEKLVGAWIIYLEPTKVKKTKGYFAVAKIQEIVPDPQAAEMYLAIIEPGSYLDFGSEVPFNDNGQIIEAGVLNDEQKISGRAQAAVRPVSSEDFTNIIEKGLGRAEDVLPRTDEQPGFAEEQTQFVVPRARIEQLTNRVARDRNFRKTVIRAYGERCAISGLRLINGGGRAEVEAAHIRSVEHDGPDIVSNGIALSATTHWMFDRGLVGLSDDLDILVSRQANDPQAIHSLINGTGKLLAPSRESDRPRSEFLAWHREHCFKH